MKMMLLKYKNCEHSKVTTFFRTKNWVIWGFWIKSGLGFGSIDNKESFGDKYFLTLFKYNFYLSKRELKL